MSICLGIDPGLNGGLAIVAGPLDHLRLFSAIQIPTTGYDAKRRVNVGAVLDFIQKHSPDLAVIERAQAMPSLPDKNGVRRGMGASSSFIYGRAVGALEACVEGLGIKLIVIESSAWKKYHGLSSRDAKGEKIEQPQVKENSRQLAIKLFGPKFFPRKMDHNIGEAALIAAYGTRLI